MNRIAGRYLHGQMLEEKGTGSWRPPRAPVSVDEQELLVEIREWKEFEK